MSENYWFSHDFNAKDDPKCMLLIDELGLEGYGVYWVLIETLRGCPETKYRYSMRLIPSLARKYGTSAPKVETVIRNYGLFEIENDEFFLSPSLCRRMEKYDEKCAQMRLNAQKGALERKKKMEKEIEILSRGDSSQHLLSDSSAEAELKEKKIEQNNTEEKKIENLSFSSVHAFKNHCVREFEGRAFFLPSNNPMGYRITTPLSIRNGYLRNGASQKDLSGQEAIDIWKYLFRNQHLLLGGEE